MPSYIDLLQIANVDSKNLKNHYISNRSSHRNNDWWFEWAVRKVHHRTDGPAIIQVKGWDGNDEHPIDSIEPGWRIFGFPIRHDAYIMLVEEPDLTKLAFKFIEMLGVVDTTWEVPMRRVFEAKYVDFAPVANAVAVAKSFNRRS